MQIYVQLGEWPDDFSKSIVVPIEKKANATECGDFRTISLMLQKLFWKFLQRESQQKEKNSSGKISSVSDRRVVQV